MRTLSVLVGSALLLGGCVAAQSGMAVDPIASAISAGPSSITDDATIINLAGDVLREGTNGYTCIPDNPNNTGADPMCVDAAWLNLGQALANKTAPSYDSIGIAYMLAGDAEVSNSDPFATEFTNHDDWVKGLGSHMMIAAPGDDAWDGVSTDPYNGGPWVMWPGTPYQHLMVPIDSFGK